MSGQQIFTFRGENNRQYIAFSITQAGGNNTAQPYFETVLIKGRISVVNVGKRTVNVPQTLSDSETFVNYTVDGVPVLVEMKGTYLLNVQASAVSNAKGESLDQAITRIKAAYLQRGFSDGDQ